MNFVKRNLDKILYIFLGIIIILLIIGNIIINNANKKRVNFLTILNNYSVSTLSDDNFEVKLYCSRNDTMYTSLSAIEEVYLKDNNTLDEYKIDLKKVEYTGLYDYENEDYYEYAYDFTIPFSCSDIINFDQCILNINYTNGENINLNIGSLGLESSKEKNRELIITKMKGLVDTIDDEQYLTGIYLDFSEEEFTIKKLIPINPIVHFDLKNAIKVNKEATLSIYDYIDDYYLLNSQLDSSNIEIDHEGIIIPLVYDKRMVTNNLGFIIEYEQDGTSKEAIVEPFCFYQGIKKDIVEKVSYDFN